MSKNLIRLGQNVTGSKTGQPLVYWGSKVWSGQVRAHLLLQGLECACKKIWGMATAGRGSWTGELATKKVWP